MGVVSIADAWPAAGQPFTVAELDLGGPKITRPPILVAEIRSPSTALVDLNAKKSAYQDFGVGSYWVVVPELATPQVIAWDLDGAGHYREVARIVGDDAFTAARPFPVEIVPSRLVAGLPRG